MFNNRSYVKMACIIMALSTLVLSFQNCAAPLDPALLEEAELKSVTPGALAFNVEVLPLEVEEGESIDLKVNHQSNSDLLEFKYTRNGLVIGDGSFQVQADNISKDDIFRVVILDDGIIVGESNIFVNVKSTVDPVTPTGEVHLKLMTGTESISYIADKSTIRLQVQPDNSKMSANDILGTTFYEWESRVTTTGAYTRLNVEGQSYLAPADYTKSGNYIRVRAYNNLSGKWSSYIYMTVYADSYKANLTDVAKLAPRKDLNQGQCEVPYFVSGVYTHYYGSIGDKHGQKIIALKCSLIKDGNNPDSVRGVGKVSATDASLDKGRLKAFGGTGSWYFGGANLTGSQNEFITGINPSQSGTSYVVYNSPEKDIDETILLTGGTDLVYEVDKTHFAECPAGTHVTGLAKVVSGSHKPLFSSRNYYYKYSRLLCGQIKKL